MADNRVACSDVKLLSGEFTVIGTKGHSVSKIVSAERGLTTTVICCMSPAGNFVPPALIFPRKRLAPALMRGAPPGSIQMCSDSGFINSDLFLEWIMHFQKTVKSSCEDPVLLIIDNHSSHMNLKAVLYCREHHIHLLSLPPHSSHKAQPLDVCFFGPLKTHYNAAAENWMAMHPGRAVSSYEVADLLNTAYSKCASVGIASKAFAAVGIWPLNSTIFTATDFVGSLVTDRPEPTPVTSAAHNVDLPAMTSVPNTEEETGVPESPSAPLLDNDQLPANPVAVNEQSDLQVTQSQSQSAGILDTNGSALTLSSSDTSSGRHISSPSASNYVSPSTIKPFPRVKFDDTRKRRASVRSEVFTASPFKRKLEEKHVMMEAKKMKAEARKLKSENSPKRKILHGKNDQMKKKVKPAKKQKCRDSRKRRKPDPRACNKTGEHRRSALNQNRNSSVTTCPACTEPYVDPPTEDWVQCYKCERWWHEDCSNYQGGSFLCDLCL